MDGNITIAGRLEGSLSAVGALQGTLSRGEGVIARTYDGEYTVTPRANVEQVLETNGKLMADDVTVFEIPYFETSNLSGTTVYIANEVEING